MSRNKHGISILEAQRLLGIGSYETAWLMSHKIRSAMARRDTRYKLAGLIELDEAYFGGKRRPKRPVLVAVSKTERGSAAFSRMQAVTQVTCDQVRSLAKESIQSDGSQIITDGKRIYPPLTEVGFQHTFHVLRSPEKASVFLPLVHLVIANVKRFLQGTHHRETPKHLQRFLDEFTYRFNRRWQNGQLFDRLLTACVSASSVTFGELKG